MPDKASSIDRRWAGAQTALTALGLFGGLLELLLRGRGFNLGSTVVSVVVGLVLAVAGILVVRRARRDLADNMTIVPTPVAGGYLVESGIYGIVRHPMYVGAILLSLGFTLILGSWIALLVTIAFIPFFFAKSRHEETLLEARYPSYREYRRRVRSRFIPWLV